MRCGPEYSCAVRVAVIERMVPPCGCISEAVLPHPQIAAGGRIEGSRAALHADWISYLQTLHAPLQQRKLRGRLLILDSIVLNVPPSPSNSLPHHLGPGFGCPDTILKYSLLLHRRAPSREPNPGCVALVRFVEDPLGILLHAEVQEGLGLQKSGKQSFHATVFKWIMLMIMALKL